MESAESANTLRHITVLHEHTNKCVQRTVPKTKHQCVAGTHLDASRLSCF